MHTANLNHEARTGWQEGRKTNCMSPMNDYSAWQARCAMSASEVARWVGRRESCKGWRFYFHGSVMYRERWRRSCSYLRATYEMRVRAHSRFSRRLLQPEYVVTGDAVLRCSRNLQQQLKLWTKISIYQSTGLQIMLNTTKGEQFPWV